MDASRTFHPFPRLPAELRQQIWKFYFRDQPMDRLKLPQRLFPDPEEAVEIDARPNGNPPSPHSPFFIPRECLLSRTTYHETLPIMLMHSRPELSTLASSEFFAVFLAQAQGLTPSTNGFWYIRRLHFKDPKRVGPEDPSSSTAKPEPKHVVHSQLLSRCPNLRHVSIHGNRVRVDEYVKIFHKLNVDFAPKKRTLVVFNRKGEKCFCAFAVYKPFFRKGGFVGKLQWKVLQPRNGEGIRVGQQSWRISG